MTMNAAILEQDGAKKYKHEAYLHITATKDFYETWKELNFHLYSKEISVQLNALI